jgi:ComF family protein
MFALEPLRALADGLMAVLLAPPCAACDRPLEHPTRGPVCSACWSQVRAFSPPLCQHCGDPLMSWRARDVDISARCPRCERQPSAISRLRAIGEYDGTLRSIIHALKYDRRPSLARPLAGLMHRECGDILTGIDFVVPVPLHRSRLRSRGFNQAALIARALSLPWQQTLRRTRATPSQTDLPAEQRHANVRDAFALTHRARVAGLVVTLVDDVSTTGATLEACARVLRDAGAREVRAVTAARVVTRSPG